MEQEITNQEIMRSIKFAIDEIERYSRAAMLFLDVEQLRQMADEPTTENPELVKQVLRIIDKERE